MIFAPFGFRKGQVSVGPTPTPSPTPTPTPTPTPAPLYPTNGLALALDAGDSSSYPGTGTTWTDLSGNANTGTLTNGPTYGGSGSGGYIDFDGTNDYVNIADASSINPTTGITFVTWFRMDSPLTANQNIISKGFTSVSPPYVQYSFKMFDNSPYNTPQFNLALGGTLRTLNGSTTMSASTWYMVACTYDKTSMKIYVNNVQDANTSSQTANISTYATSLSLARWPTGNSQFLNGQIAMTLIYNRALSATEVGDIWTATKSRYGY
jgi:hypothetical protein